MNVALRVGQGAQLAWREAEAVWFLFVRVLYYAFRGRRARGAFAEQLYQIGNRSLFFMTTVMGFVGMITVFQAGLQLKRIIPDMTQIGASFAELLIRNFGPDIGALMLATRVGAGIAAEIGSMAVTEQLDALRMNAADPVEFLVVPRFLATVVMTVVLVVWGTAVAEGVGMATGMLVFDIRPGTFLSLALVDVGDVVVGLTKCVAYGAAIPILSARAGLSAYGGSEGVGTATTNAVVASSFAVIVLNSILSGIGFLVFP